MPAGLWTTARCSSSYKTSRGKISFFPGPGPSGINKRILSPPFIIVAVVATTSLTVTYCFFIAFLKADLVIALLKIPMPYS
jgi:hypothetical protein